MSNERQHVHAWGLTRIELAQRKELLICLIETDGNKSACARELGVSRPTVREWIEKYHIHEGEWKYAREFWGIVTKEFGHYAWHTYPYDPTGKIALKIHG